MVNTSIEYTYDPLYRLVAAAYSGHITAEYSYTYDEAGNRTGYTAMLTNTVATTYTYNAANQLLTAKASDSPDTWYYAYDGNGNQVRQVPNGLTPAAGETRYTFNQRGRLVRSEQYAGGSYQTQATAGYNDDDQRLRVTLFVGGLPITTTYVVDAARNGLPLAQRGAAGDVSLLYGLFPLGEYGEEWRYYLGDGQFSVRGVVDGAGDLLLARTYDPFGGLLRQAGTGNVLFGFMGAQAGPDGLLYVNGRYFNPATGRFLSPDNGSFDPKRPRTLNGYLAVILFFGMPLSAFFAHKRGRGKYPQVWVLFGLLFLTNLVSCQTPEPPGLPTQPPPVQPPPTGAPDPNPSGCTDGYERPRCPRHAGWNGHKETMQGILNRVAVTVANRTGDPIKNIVYAPETVFLRGKGLIIEGGEAAVPTTQAMYDAMSKKGEQIVGSLQKAITAGSDRADYSCNEIVGLALNLDDFIGLGSWHWSNYTANFIFENVQEPDVVIYGQKYGDNNVFVGHAALIAYLHPTNSELTITVQSDGSATESGIFFIHVQDSRHVLQFTTLFGERRHD
ncbi:MAG: hypothetical protein IAE79_02085 [Anaerolinea sp.]|nr:hypothetical protein [Anaerolinea sp.]